MALAPYTTNDQVRATLGVTVEELADATLDLEIYEKNLVMELDAIGGDSGNDGALVDAFTTVSEIPEANRTRSQARLYDAVVLFSPYVVALHLETAAPVFTPKSVTDGKAAVTRYSTDPFGGVFKAAREQYDRYRVLLGKAWASYSSTDATGGKIPNLFGASSPSNDPVTGT